MTPSFQNRQVPSPQNCQTPQLKSSLSWLPVDQPQGSAKIKIIPYQVVEHFLFSADVLTLVIFEAPWKLGSSCFIGWALGWCMANISSWIGSNMSAPTLLNIQQAPGFEVRPGNAIGAPIQYTGSWWVDPADDLPYPMPNRKKRHL